MPILSYSRLQASLEVRCASCKAQRSVPTAGLTVHAVDPEATHTVILPACGCGAVEHLMVTRDAHPPKEKNRHSEHRRVVNVLALDLHGEGKLSGNARHPSPGDLPKDHEGATEFVVP